MIAGTKGAAIAIAAYPDLMVRAVTVSTVHRLLAARLGGSCGIWHHAELTAEQVATQPTDRQPTTPSALTAGWVACWQHPTGTHCPGPAPTGAGTAGDDVVLPALHGIRKSFTGCSHATDQAVTAAWDLLTEDACLDGCRRIVTSLLAAHRHHVTHHGAAVLLPDPVPARPGVDVVLALYAALTAGDQGLALRRWVELVHIPADIPGIGAGDQWAAEWHEAVGTSLAHAMRMSAFLLRAAERTALNLPDHQACQVTPCDQKDHT